MRWLKVSCAFSRPGRRDEDLTQGALVEGQDDAQILLHVNEAAHTEGALVKGWE